MNRHNFSFDLVHAVYQACVDAGIHYMEVGYKNSRALFAKDEHGPWKFCDEDDLRRAVGDNPTDLKLSVMADAERCNFAADLKPKDQSVIDMVRVAAYINQVPMALDMIKEANDKGYETTINLMAVSNVQEHDLDQALEALVTSEAQTIYLVDSFGAFYSEQIQYLTKKYLLYARQSGKQVGIHAHNNLQLAFANTIESLILGSSLLDATMRGLGRGAGNCPMELLLGFLRNPRFRMRPILECIETQIDPLRESIVWGYDIPYMLTGFLNRHPRTAIEVMEDPKRRREIVKFYDVVHDAD